MIQGRVAEYTDVEQQMWRADCKVRHGLLTVQGIGDPNCFIVQGLTVVD